MQSIQLCVNGINEQIGINEDKTFEHTFVNVPITNMDYFTSACKDELKTLDLSSLDTSQVTSMIRTFDHCNKLTSIDLKNVDTSNVTDMTQMFNGCNSLTSLDVSNFDTSQVTNMNGMFGTNFYNYILDLSNFNTSNVTDMGEMFYFNSSMTDLYIKFDVSSVKKFFDIFKLNLDFKNVVGKFEGTKFDLDLNYSPLTAQSAMVFINGLATVTEKRRLALKDSTYDSLTAEQIAIATAKGWTVTRS